MPSHIHFALQLLDPRGRCDRKGFLTAAGALLALQATAVLGLWLSETAFDSGIVAAGNLAFLWLGYAAVSKRLHDIGRSAWWVPGGILAWVLGATIAAVGVVLFAGPQVLEPGRPGYWVVFAVMMLPLLGIALWLHFAAGEPGANRYGPAPAGGGFSTPARG